MSPVFFPNPHRAAERFVTPTAAALRFHQTIPGYAPTALANVEALARQEGAASLRVKVENGRFGLPAFKILGASWAVSRALSRDGRTIASWTELIDAAAALTKEGPFWLVAATDGNHGRAVARLARLLGLRSQIFVPKAMSDERRHAIEGEGAEVTIVPGDYDLAVHAAQAARSKRTLLVADVLLEEGDPVPSWVIDGYSTLFFEIDEALGQGAQPNFVVVQIGVGALAAAVVRHYRRPDAPKDVFILGVEPMGAACALESVRHGAPTRLEGSAESAMAGLNCESVSLAAWKEMLHGIDAFVAIEDEWTFEAMRELAAAGVTAGESGAAGVAGFLAVSRTRAMAFPEAPRVLAVISEGATDAAAYAQVVTKR